jgi:heme exporter protein D
MFFLWIVIAVVVLLLVVAARIVKARRAGRPIRDVDFRARREARRAAQTEDDMRGHRQDLGGGGLF